MYTFQKIFLIISYVFLWFFKFSFEIFRKKKKTFLSPSTEKFISYIFFVNKINLRSTRSNDSYKPFCTFFTERFNRIYVFSGSWFHRWIYRYYLIFKIFLISFKKLNSLNILKFIYLHKA